MSATTTTIISVRTDGKLLTVVCDICSYCLDTSDVNPFNGVLAHVIANHPGYISEKVVTDLIS